MENSGGILARVGERILGWIALALIIGAGVGIYMMGADGRTALWNGIWRSAVWLAIAAALPWTARLFITRIAEVGSNWASLALLAGYTLINIISGVILLTAWPGSGWSWFAALAALGVVASYNYLVSEYLAEQAGV